MGLRRFCGVAASVASEDRCFLRLARKQCLMKCREAVYCRVRLNRGKYLHSTGF
jgi:hypothetical protein